MIAITGNILQRADDAGGREAGHRPEPRPEDAGGSTGPSHTAVTPDAKAEPLGTGARRGAATTPGNGAAPPAKLLMARMFALQEAVLSETRDLRVAYQQLVTRLDALEGREHTRRKAEAEVVVTLRKSRDRAAQAAAEKLCSLLLSSDGWDEFTPSTGDRFDGNLHADSRQRVPTPDPELDGRVCKVLTVGFVRNQDGVVMVPPEVTRFRFKKK